ncbi:MAG: TIGR03960 family B12-binding radical SAM protein [Alphaproteobacteria bacterium]|nr:TIGR03960 family B12-binding radical SAM protein [Alphaproteobacteria bacterium]
MNVADVLHAEILPLVEKPSRYLGTEVNAVHKDPSQVQVRIALAFPDLYDLGLGNLGIHILYAVLNRLPWAWCERTYAPGLDMERELRARGLPLFALESKDGLGMMDGLGITLQSELTYSNILNILDMAGIPLRTADRDDTHPLTFAGGPAVFNPEPIAPFMDFFVIGDGEDVIVEIAEVLRDLKGARRKTKLLALSRIEGVYVPELYPFETLPNGAILPRVDAPPIRKRLVRDLDGAAFPTDYIVPFTQQVHDRVSLEVLRGCTQGCRFCQAGMVTRPVRERTLDRVDQLLKRTLAATGYEEVSLVSLSTCDHSRVRQLVENTVEAVKDDHVSVSLPSLRLDSFSVDLADMVAETRRTGLTFAPEAASPRLRAVINKWIPDEELLEMADRAFELQWSHVKLYFMIGLPTERDDDILAIADLAHRTLSVGKRRSGRARVNLGVSTFVPKPFTPFQWAAQIPLEETERRQDILSGALRSRDIKFGRHEPEETFLEGLVSRADRRAADLLEAAFRKGCRFDAWGEHLRFDLWQEAIAETGYDVVDALRERDPDERLPWDHLDVFIPKQWFREDWERAIELRHAPDCRHKRCHKCGVIDVERELCASMLRDNIEGRKLEAAWTRKTPEGVQRDPTVPSGAPPVVQRLWLRIGRTESARFLSHLETQAAWLRSLRRCRVPLAYSQGFHPHPKMAFSTAAPLGEASVGDYLDVSLTAPVDPDLLRTQLQATVPEGFAVLDVRVVPLDSPSLMGLNAGGVYKVQLPDLQATDVAARVQALADAPELTVDRKGKTRKGQKRGQRRPRVVRSIDIRPMIRAIRMDEDAGGVPTVHLELADVDGRPGKPAEIVPLLTDDASRARVVRVETLRADRGPLRPMFADLDSRHDGAPDGLAAGEAAAPTA